MFASAILAAKTYYVGANQIIRSIKEGIRIAHQGDSVIVLAGLYKEGNIIIDKPLTFIGKNYPILDGEKKYEVLSIKAGYVEVNGFQIQHSGFASLDDPGGIKVYDQQHVTICNNLLEDNFFGIYIQYGKHCLVKNNRIKAYGTEEQHIGNGIHCWKSDSLQIIGNKVSGHRDGIYFEFVTN